MFFCNSAIPVKVTNISNDKLTDHYFFEKNIHSKNTRKFFSINFYDENNNTGEVCYTNSYEYGQMNILNFMYKDNIFYLFTSSIQHIKFFKKIINHMFENEIIFEILRIPLKQGKLVNFNNVNIENFSLIQADGIYGIKGTLYSKYLINLYTNGVITFPFTNDKQLVEQILITSLKIINLYGENKVDEY
ncbi:hypothetical protein [Bacillus massiliigorillae]|uniref:hypothetical protein n=1 Tax=Bacillus massiliigorillae TaxID=1243664 RepID=UPI0003AAD95D|nr:hypothetical protein [Bacillus massiliigorillae]